jgi:hypothetical protein
MRRYREIAALFVKLGAIFVVTCRFLAVFSGYVPYGREPEGLTLDSE